MLAELHKLFRHLHSSSLPASPLGLTKSFGWSESQLHEPQDVGAFMEKFQAVLLNIGGPVSDSFEAVFSGELLIQTRRLEAFFSAVLPTHSLTSTLTIHVF